MNGGVITHESVFDIMDGLEWSTDALAQPESIVKVEYEHGLIYAHQAPITPAEPGFVEEVQEREQVPDTGQLHIDVLARFLKNFQDMERKRYGVSDRETSISELSAEDYYASEDESVLEDEEPPNSSDEYHVAPQMQL